MSRIQESVNRIYSKVGHGCLRLFRAIRVLMCKEACADEGGLRRGYLKPPENKFAFHRVVWMIRYF